MPTRLGLAGGTASGRLHCCDMGWLALWRPPSQLVQRGVGLCNSGGSQLSPFPLPHFSRATHSPSWSHLQLSTSLAPPNFLSCHFPFAPSPWVVISPGPAPFLLCHGKGGGDQTGLSLQGVSCTSLPLPAEVYPIIRGRGVASISRRGQLPLQSASLPSTVFLMGVIFPNSRGFSPQMLCHGFFEGHGGCTSPGKADTSLILGRALHTLSWSHGPSGGQMILHH